MVVALAACSASDAAPGSAAPPPGVNPPFALPAGTIATVPTGWLPEPALATTAAAQLPGATAQAWGEPAMGCYAAALTFSGGGAPATLGKALLDDVRKVVAVREVVEPVAGATSGVLAFAFDKTPYRGRVRANLGGGSVSALACFWNDREPAACEAACTAMIGSMR